MRHPLASANPLQDNFPFFVASFHLLLSGTHPFTQQSGRRMCLNQKKPRHKKPYINFAQKKGSCLSTLLLSIDGGSASALRAGGLLTKVPKLAQNGGWCT